MITVSGGADLMLQAEVAELFRVAGRTVNRWAREGRLHPIRTPGGTLRYLTGEVRAVYAGVPLTPEQLSELREQWARGQA